MQQLQQHVPTGVLYSSPQQLLLVEPTSVVLKVARFVGPTHGTGITHLVHMNHNTSQIQQTESNT